MATIETAFVTAGGTATLSASTTAIAPIPVTDAPANLVSVANVGHMSTRCHLRKNAIIKTMTNVLAAT